MQQMVCISYELPDYMELLTMSLGTGARLLGGVTALLTVEWHCWQVCCQRVREDHGRVNIS